MAIDPMLYQKLSGRSGDPHTRLGQVLAKDAKSKQERDAMPKGAAGGFRTMLLPGMFMQMYYWLKNRARMRG